MENIPPAEWGGAFWKTLFTLARAYPLRSPSLPIQQAMGDLLHSLETLLPCATCRAHYQQYISLHEPDLSGRMALNAWMQTLKNEIESEKKTQTRSSGTVMQHLRRRQARSRGINLAQQKPSARALANRRNAGCRACEKRWNQRS